MFRGIGNSLLNPRNVQEYTAVRTSAPFAHLSPDRSGNVVARQQFGWAFRVFIALRIPPTFLLRIGGLVYIERTDILEHKLFVVSIPKYASFVAYSFSV